MSVLQVTDATFEQQVLRNELPVLVDLYADWCQPCKQLAPIVEEVARELEGKVAFAKVDIDRNPMVAQTFRVQSIPMLVLIYQGQIAGHHMGVLSKKELLQMLEPFLPAEAAELKPAELAQLLKARKAVPVDIRDAPSFGRYRIPGATNLPADEVLTRAAELVASDGRIRVLYGRTDEQSKELAKTLGDQGVEVGFLAGGFLHWEADGLEVERG
jgi:thioredoxin 1/putative thioredoxin